MGGKLIVIQDVNQARAIGQSKDVDGQREASEEGEEEFHVREVSTLPHLHLW